jgi:hypothetical protein
MLECHHDMKWSLSRENASERVRQQIGTKIMLTVSWGVDSFHVVDLMTSQRSFNSDYFMNHALAPMVAKVFPGGEFYILVDYNFAETTAEFTFQKPLSNLSLKIILNVCLPHFTVLILHYRTSL